MKTFFHAANTQTPNIPNLCHFLIIDIGILLVQLCLFSILIEGFVTNPFIQDRCTLLDNPELLMI